MCGGHSSGGQHKSGERHASGGHSMWWMALACLLPLAVFVFAGKEVAPFLVPLAFAGMVVGHVWMARGHGGGKKHSGTPRGRSGGGCCR